MKLYIFPDWDGTYRIEKHEPCLQDKSLIMCEKVAHGFKTIGEAHERIRFMGYDAYLAAESNDQAPEK